MQIFWGLTGYLPLILYGLILYGLLVALPRRWRGARKSRFGAPVPEAAGRRRTLDTLGLADIAVPPQSAPPPPVTQDAKPLSETLSVILRRQIPPRFDMPARSWLGGLPCMPDHVGWPRSVSSEKPQEGERPLHFLAQICCTDLPAELWARLGPREGWLLLFIDPNQGCPEGDDAFRILHILETGPERAPPVDLGAVHDGVYTGADYRYLLPGEEVPKLWRRWPVDIVPVANEARQENGRVLAAPENFASSLYSGADIAKDMARPTPVRPLLYGHLLYALSDLRKGLERSVPPVQLSPVFCTELRKEGAIAALADHCHAEAERLGSDLFRRQAVWLRDMGDAEAIIRYLEESPALETIWQDRLRAHVDRVIETVQHHDAEAPLPAAEWDELVAAFHDRSFIRWQSGRSDSALSFREHRRDGNLQPPAAMRELIADLYIDRKRCALVPQDIAARYEPFWRQLRSNRPHRMGGYHDGLQSDAVIGPSSEYLLFQIASDDAMHWCWGDVGAYYFWIDSKHLAAGDFSAVQMHLECH